MDILFNILHVVSAVFIIGPIAIMPMAALRSLRHGDNERSIKTGKSVRLLSYLSLIVVVTGFGVMGMADPKYDLTITTITTEDTLHWAAQLQQPAYLTCPVRTTRSSRPPNHKGRLRASVNQLRPRNSLPRRRSRPHGLETLTEAAGTLPDGDPGSLAWARRDTSHP